MFTSNVQSFKHCGHVVSVVCIAHTLHAYQIGTGKVGVAVLALLN